MTEDASSDSENRSMTDHRKPILSDGGISQSGESALTAAGFFDALSDERLIGGRCEDCEAVLLPPRPICNECGGRDVVAEELPLNGTIVSHTNIHKTAPTFAEMAPLPVAIVELDSTGRLPGRIDAPYDEISIGDRVRIEIREPSGADESFALGHEEDWPIHVFVPDTEK